MAALVGFWKDDPAFPGYRFAFLNGFSTLEHQRSILVRWNGVDGLECKYLRVGQIPRVMSGADLEPGDFVPLPDMTQDEVMLLLAPTTPAAAYIHYTIQERPDNVELETAMLRVAVVHKPNLQTLTARQERLVAGFRGQ